MATDLPRPEPGGTSGFAPGAASGTNPSDSDRHPTAPGAVGAPDWRQTLPVLTSATVTARELVTEDASSLLPLLAAEEVTRFVSPLPATRDEFERFIAWTHRQRALGQYVCFAVVPVGMSSPVGVFQLRSLEPGFATAEWGFALGSPYWGTGLFVAAAHLVLDFAFGTIGVRRLEARACVHNVRGNGALRKLGATAEGVLRRAFRSHDRFYDQVLWSILESDWRAATARGRSGSARGNARVE
ncbi:MAG: GNAT family N-acetyltransferase [Acidobacteria bacterium]|nr:GNAT family N-acetyltransferase [Acidobacteriota bacterium]